MEFEHIKSTSHLHEFCAQIAAEEWIGFDTEFVSEDSFFPELCLLQIAAGEHLAVVDTLADVDLDSFWQLLLDEERITIVHAGREEVRFCRRAVGAYPANIFDIQLAAGFCGHEYPAAYSTLISKLLKKSLPKGETRTNWRRRPLSDRQLNYAVHDVTFLFPIYEKLGKSLDKLERRPWLEDEIQCWLSQIQQNDEQQAWWRTSGISNLAPRSLAIVREVWLWRDSVARERNRPAKRVLRDDLIVELARRKTADVKRIRSVRGMEHRGLSRYHDDIAKAVKTALDLDDDECPERPRKWSTRQQHNLLGQFLNVCLSAVCQSAKIAPSIVGTTDDVRQLIAYYLGDSSGAPPALADGWRADVVGDVLREIMYGERTVQVRKPTSDAPLTMKKKEEGKDEG